MNPRPFLFAAALFGCAGLQRAPSTQPAAQESSRSKSLPADAPVAEKRALAEEMPQIPTVPGLIKDCQPVFWGTVAAGGLDGAAVCLAGPCSDTFDPNPGGAPPQWVRGLKGFGQLGAAVLTPVVVALISALGQCRDDAAKTASPNGGTR